MSIDPGKPKLSAPVWPKNGQRRQPLQISIIAAVAANGVIGHEGRIPWRLASDLEHFRALTFGKPMLMGRKTYQSIGRPLPGRVSIVLSRTENLAVSAGVVVAADIESALSEAAGAAHALDTDSLALIGGADLFATMLDRVARLYLTFVDLAPPGDTFFPPIDWSLWRETRREKHLPQKGDDAPFSFVEFERRLDRGDVSVSPFPRAESGLES